MSSGIISKGTRMGKRSASLCIATFQRIAKSAVRFCSFHASGSAVSGTGGNVGGGGDLMTSQCFRRVIRHNTSNDPLEENGRNPGQVSSGAVVVSMILTISDSLSFALDALAIRG